MTQAAVAQNWFATLALLAWPFIALWLYHTRPVNQATLWTILGGYLLLPVGASVKLAEGIPQLDKISIPALAALAGCFSLYEALTIFERIWIGRSFVAHVFDWPICDLRAEQ